MSALNYNAKEADCSEKNKDYCCRNVAISYIVMHFFSDLALCCKVDEGVGFRRDG